MTPDGFQDEFIRLERPLRAYLTGVTSGRLHDADDLFQEVWRVAWRRLPDFDDNRPFKAWILGIARLEALKWRQRCARSREVLSEQMMDALAETAVRDAETLIDRHGYLLDCVTELNGSARDVINLKYFHRLKIRQIAARMSRKVAAVEMQLVRIRRLLKDCIDRKIRLAGCRQ